jgi:hypothetical protein
LWDFFECNSEKGGGVLQLFVVSTLNSLCGISLNATGLSTGLRAAAGSTPLNSLCGISLNATLEEEVRI